MLRAVFRNPLNVTIRVGRWNHTPSAVGLGVENVPPPSCSGQYSASLARAVMGNPQGSRTIIGAALRVAAGWWSPPFTSCSRPLQGGFVIAVQPVTRRLNPSASPWSFSETDHRWYSHGLRDVGDYRVPLTRAACLRREEASNPDQMGNLQPLTARNPLKRQGRGKSANGGTAFRQAFPAPKQPAWAG